MCLVWLMLSSSRRRWRIWPASSCFVSGDDAVESIYARVFIATNMPGARCVISHDSERHWIALAEMGASSLPIWHCILHGPNPVSLAKCTKAPLPTVNVSWAQEHVMRTLVILRSLALFVAAGLCEISGGWLMWKWLRDHKSGWWGLVGALILIVYG